MTFSYTQISQYLRCPRSYRYRYLDGWREKDSRASLCFGRCFEKALAAFFEGEDAGAVLFKEWGAYREAQLEYSHGDDWERVLRQGIAAARAGWPKTTAFAFANLNATCRRSSFGHSQTATSSWPTSMPSGTLDGTRRLLEWKTTTARYPEQPEGLTSLDLQLICYSWISGISDVAIVAFVRKRVPEIQYLTGFDHRRAAAGVWSTGRGDGQSDRNGQFLLTQRHPLPAERLCQLLASGAVPRERATDRNQTDSSTRSERP